MASPKADAAAPLDMSALSIAADPADAPPVQNIVVTMEDEKLGIKFQRDAQGAVVRGLTTGGAAELQPVAIPIGARLAAVNSASTMGLDYDDILQRIKAAPRPLTLQFEIDAAEASEQSTKAAAELEELRDTLLPPVSPGTTAAPGGLAGLVSPGSSAKLAATSVPPVQLGGGMGGARGAGAPAPSVKSPSKIQPIPGAGASEGGWGSWLFGSKKAREEAPEESKNPYYMSEESSPAHAGPGSRRNSGTASAGYASADPPSDVEARRSAGPAETEESESDYSDYSESDDSDTFAPPDPSDPSNPRPRWVYMLKPARADMLTSGPNKREGHYLEQHYQYVRRMARRGVVEFAGATLNTDGSAFGLVMFAADTEDAALRFLSRDPAVRTGVLMTKLFPFQVTIQTADPHATGQEPRIPADSVKNPIMGTVMGGASGASSGGKTDATGIEIQTAASRALQLAPSQASSLPPSSTAAILQAQLDDALSQLDDAREKVTSLSVDNASLERRLGEVEDTLEETLAQVADAEATGAEKATQELKKELRFEAQREMKEAIGALRSMLMASKVDLSDVQTENRELREYIASGHAGAMQLSMGDGSSGGNAQFLAARVLEAQQLRRAADEARTKLMEDAKQVFDLMTTHANSAAALEKDAASHYQLLAGVLSGEERRQKDLPKTVATVVESVSGPSARAQAHEAMLGGGAPRDSGNVFFEDGGGAQRKADALAPL